MFLKLYQIRKLNNLSKLESLSCLLCKILANVFEVLPEKLACHWKFQGAYRTDEIHQLNEGMRSQTTEIPAQELDVDYRKVIFVFLLSNLSKKSATFPPMDLLKKNILMNPSSTFFLKPSFILCNSFKKIQALTLYI